MNFMKVVSSFDFFLKKTRAHGAGPVWVQEVGTELKILKRRSPKHGIREIVYLPYSCASNESVCVIFNNKERSELY
jgi:hypothetical protein